MIAEPHRKDMMWDILATSVTKSSGEAWKLIWTVVINALSFSGLDPSKVLGSFSRILAVGMQGYRQKSAMTEQC